MGRRRIEMKRIENREARNVTFCKRRTGLFKKLSELCILCDSEAAALVYSPGGRVYVFSHPDAPSVFRRFFSGRPLPGIETAFHPERETAADLSAASDEVEEITKAERAMKRWWEETSFEGMDPGKLRRLRRSVAGLRQAVQEKTKQQFAERDELAMHAALMPPLFPAVQNFPSSMPAAVCSSCQGIMPKAEVEAYLDQNKRTVE